MATGKPVQTPDCPMCGMPPVMKFTDQYWCGNNSCRLIFWTPSKTIAENLRDSRTFDV